MNPKKPSSRESVKDRRKAVKRKRAAAAKAKPKLERLTLKVIDGAQPLPAELALPAFDEVKNVRDQAILEALVMGYSHSEAVSYVKQRAGLKISRDGVRMWSQRHLPLVYRVRAQLQHNIMVLLDPPSFLAELIEVKDRLGEELRHYLGMTQPERTKRLAYKRSSQGEEIKAIHTAYAEQLRLILETMRILKITPDSGLGAGEGRNLDEFTDVEYTAEQWRKWQQAVALLAECEVIDAGGQEASPRPERKVEVEVSPAPGRAKPLPRQQPEVEPPSV